MATFLIIMGLLNMLYVSFKAIKDDVPIDPYSTLLFGLCWFLLAISDILLDILAVQKTALKLMDKPLGGKYETPGK